MIMSKKLLASLLSALTFLGSEAGVAAGRKTTKSDASSPINGSNPGKLDEPGNAKSDKVSGVQNESASPEKNRSVVVEKKDLPKDLNTTETKNGKVAEKEKDSSNKSENPKTKAGSGKKNSSNDNLKGINSKNQKSSRPGVKHKSSRSRGVSFSVNTVKNYREINRAIKENPRLRKALSVDMRKNSFLRYSPTLLALAPFGLLPPALRKTKDDKSAQGTAHSLSVNANVDPISALGKKTTVGGVMKAWAQCLQNYNRKIDNPDNRVAAKALTNENVELNIRALNDNRNDGKAEGSTRLFMDGHIEDKKEGRNLLNEINESCTSEREVGKEFDNLTLDGNFVGGFGDVKKLFDIWKSDIHLRAGTNPICAPGGMFGPAFVCVNKQLEWDKINIDSDDSVEVYDVSEIVWNNVIDAFISYLKKPFVGKLEFVEGNWIFRTKDRYEFKYSEQFEKVAGGVLRFAVLYFNKHLPGKTGKSPKGSEWDAFGYGFAKASDMGFNLVSGEIADGGSVNVGAMHIWAAGQTVFDTLKGYLKSGLQLIDGEENVTIKQFHEVIKAILLNLNGKNDEERNEKSGVEKRWLDNKLSLIDSVFNLLDPKGSAIDLLKIVKDKVVPVRDAIRTLDLAKFDNQELIDSIVKIKNPNLTRADFIKGVKEILKLLQSS